MMQSGIIKYIETSYNSGITLGGISYPPQGMSSSVFFIRLKGLDCAVKYGKDAMKDIPALKVIEDAKVNVPIPKLVESFIFDGIPVIILQKIEDPLYESVSGTDMPKYVPAMISVLNELHKIKSNLPGLLDRKSVV